MSGGSVLTGFLLGVLFTLGTVYLPARSRWRTRVAEIEDIHRIEAGWARAEAHIVDLADANGAFEEARAVYTATYPGRGREPDPAWVTWIREGGREVDGPRYQPAHADGDATQPLVPTVQVGTVQTDHFPVWGQEWWPTPEPVVNWLAWRWSDWLVAPVALMLTRYRWYNRAWDRVWEAGIVFEASGQRVNRLLLDSLDQYAEALAALPADAGAALAEIYWLNVELIGGAVTRARRAFPRRRARVTYRPKRYYPIKEG